MKTKSTVDDELLFTVERSLAVIKQLIILWIIDESLFELCECDTEFLSFLSPYVTGRPVAVCKLARKTLAGSSLSGQWIAADGNEHGLSLGDAIQIRFVSEL